MLMFGFVAFVVGSSEHKRARHLASLHRPASDLHMLRSYDTSNHYIEDSVNNSSTNEYRQSLSFTAPFIAIADDLVRRGSLL